MSTQHSDEYDEAYPLGDGRQEMAQPTGVKCRAERIVSSGNWPDVGATDNWLGIPANALQFRVLCCCNLAKLVDQEKKESKGRLKKKKVFPCNTDQASEVFSAVKLRRLKLQQIPPSV